MLDWSLIDLARAADVSVSSVLCFEMRGADALAPLVVGRIQQVLERKGITFLADDGCGCGVRLRPASGADAAVEPTLSVQRQDTPPFQVILGMRASDGLG